MVQSRAAAVSASPRSAGKQLYQHQASLPHLPVPPLEQTCQKYVQSVRPYLNADQLQRTQRRVQAFAQSEQGQTLQQRLEQRASRPGVTNWLADWWNDIAYLRVRDPVVVFVSYFYAYEDHLTRMAPAQRAADIAYGALVFCRQVLDEALEPEYARRQPLCMEPYQNMFHTCRIPGSPVDTLGHYTPAEHDYFAVVHKNQFYVVPTQYQGTPLTLVELEQQFERILTAGRSLVPALGALTADNRDIWTENRKKLLAASPRNRALLAKLEGATFLVCLDDTAPVTREEHSSMCWHGDGRNRFYDKPLQFIVAANGKAGFLGEHAGMDGMVTSRLSNYVLDHVDQHRAAAAQQSSAARQTLPAPEPLDFVLDAAVTKAIAQAEQRFDQLIRDHQIRVLAYPGYGKSLIKQFKVSPDSYVQMLMQLAYYKMYGEDGPTYESVQTRQFARGRTEVCRSVSDASHQWVRAMQDPALATETKATLARQAMAAHSSYMRDAAAGQGIDRHLLGLRMCLLPNETKPAMFEEPVFSHSCHWRLSTSQLSSPHFSGWGYGEVVPDGYGLAYMIKDNALHFNITCLNTRPDVNASRLHHYLQEAAEDMRRVMAAASAPAAKL
ncbi:Carnitine O-acetyltransferase mitochondrial [Dimargaris xerosporica]|nr:Carnitine O-acetyltransferase mitochondrial [Dimargaris xerosporica]